MKNFNNFLSNFYHAPRKTTIGEVIKLFIFAAVCGIAGGIVLTALLISIFG